MKRLLVSPSQSSPLHPGILKSGWGLSLALPPVSQARQSEGCSRSERRRRGPLLLPFFYPPFFPLLCVRECDAVRVGRSRRPRCGGPKTVPSPRSGMAVSFMRKALGAPVRPGLGGGRLASSRARQDGVWRLRPLPPRAP